MSLFSIKKYNLISILILVINPYLSIPTIIYGIQKKNYVSINFLIIIIALITYQLVPFDTMDLAVHYKFYSKFSVMEPSEFFMLLLLKTDYAFYLVLFFAAKLGVKAQLIMALFTFFTLKLFYYTICSFEKSHPIPRKYFLLLIITFLISLELIAIFSGIRNMFGVSIAFAGILKGLSGKKGYGFVLVFLSAFVHFSLLSISLMYFFIFYLSPSFKLTRYIFLFSFLFVFLLNKDILHQFVTSLPIPEIFNQKIEGYLFGEDIVQAGINASSSARISYFIRNSWVWVAMLYLIYTTNQKSLLRQVILVYFSFLNLMYSAPDIFLRYTYLGKCLFFLVLIYELHANKNKTLFFIFQTIFVLGFIVNTIILRDLFFSSLFDDSAISTISILAKKIDLHQYFNAS